VVRGHWLGSGVPGPERRRSPLVSRERQPRPPEDVQQKLWLCGKAAPASARAHRPAARAWCQARVIPSMPSASLGLAKLGEDGFTCASRSRIFMACVLPPQVA
jgi:hypothetical protein